MTTLTRRRTDDRDEAEQIVTDLYLPHRLDLSSSSAGLAMDMAGMVVGALTVGRLAYGRRIGLRTADAENFHVNFTPRGRARARSGASAPATTVAGEALVYSPGAPAEMAWSADCQQLCLMVPRTRLESALEQLLGRSLRGPLRFEFAADLRRQVGRRWRTVLGLLVDELDHPTAAGGDARMGKHVEGLVLDGLLLSQQHSHSDALHPNGAPRLGSAIKRAVELMEERPSEPWTTIRLATEVHLSARALQEGFRRDLATPPMTYLRQVRLRHAREALQAADRDATTVRTLALQLGILHMGRFAAAYRDAYGETPSDTLHRPA